MTTFDIIHSHKDEAMYDRSKTIGASDAVMIQAGQWAELYDKKQGTTPPEYGMAARLGHELESLNRELFFEETGHEIATWHDDDDPATMGDYGGKREKWCKLLPDGVVHIGQHRIPFEAKAINGMWKPHFLLSKYMPQLQHAMRIMQAPYCFFSVIYLNTKYEVTKVPYDPPYDKALFDRESLFEWHLRKGIRPPEKKGRNWI